MVNKNKINNYGFTLVELLAVIIILSLLMIVATSSVGKSLFNTKKKLLEVAAKKYYNEVYEELYSEYLLNGSITTDSGTANGTITKEDGDYKFTFTIQNNKITTIKGQYDDNVYIANVNTDITTGTKNELNGNSVSKGKSDINICTLISGEEGKYNIGDKYSCLVSSTHDPYTFNIFKTDGNKVYMIMDSNICNDGSSETSNDTSRSDCVTVWSDDTTYRSGPDEALNFLNIATSSWDMLEDLNVTHGNKATSLISSNFYYVTFSGQARLLYYTEYDEIKATNFSALTGTNNKNLRYYTADPHYTQSTNYNAYAVFTNSDGNPNYNNGIPRLEGVSILSNGFVRPVIELNK